MSSLRCKGSITERSRFLNPLHASTVSVWKEILSMPTTWKCASFDDPDDIGYKRVAGFLFDFADHAVQEKVQERLQGEP